MTRHDALGKRCYGPQERTGLARLLGWTDPNGVLLRFDHGDVVVEDFADGGGRTDGTFIIPSGLHVDSLDRLVQNAVAEGDVVDGGTADGSDDQAEAAAVDPLKEHVPRSIFNRDAIVLAPNVAVVNVNVPSGDVETVRIESGQVVEGVAVQLRDARLHFGVPDDETIRIAGRKSPKRTV